MVPPPEVGAQTSLENFVSENDFRKKSSTNTKLTDKYSKKTLIEEFDFFLLYGTDITDKKDKERILQKLSKTMRK